MVDAIMPKLSIFKKLILRNYWPSLQRIQKVTCPILFVSGEIDELVPPAQMQALKSNAVQARFIDWFFVSGGDHNFTWMRAGETYVIRMNQFIKRCLSED